MFPNFDPYAMIGSGAITFFTSVISLICSLLSAAVYIVNGIAILNLCKKLSIPNGWLGFVPIADAFKIGQIANKCCEFEGKKKRYDKAILIPTIIMYVLFIPLLICFWILIFSTFGTETASDFVFPIFSFLMLCLCYLLILAAAIVASIFVYIAYYKIFKVFAPQNAVLFIVLSIVLNVPYVLLLIASLKAPAVSQQPRDETPYYYPVNN